MTWLRDSLIPGVRKKNSEEELEAARKAEAEKGHGSVFDAVAATEIAKEEDGEREGLMVKKTKKADQVCRGSLTTNIFSAADPF